MAQYECSTCGYIYDEALGCPEDGIPRGTKFEDLPEDWCCLECSAPKEDFVAV